MMPPTTIGSIKGRTLSLVRCYLLIIRLYLLLLTLLLLLLIVFLLSFFIFILVRPMCKAAAAFLYVFIGQYIIHYTHKYINGLFRGEDINEKFQWPRRQALTIDTCVQTVTFLLFFNSVIDKKLKIAPIFLTVHLRCAPLCITNSDNHKNKSNECYSLLYISGYCPIGWSQSLDVDINISHCTVANHTNISSFLM